METLLTAAHCVKFPDDKKEANPEELLVYLGKHALFSWSETEIQTKEVIRQKNDVKLLYIINDILGSKSCNTPAVWRSQYIAPTRFGCSFF